MSNEPLLATLYGGVAVGAGIGFIFKGGGSAGGGTIIARIVTSKTSFKKQGSVILFFGFDCSNFLPELYLIALN